MLLVLLFVAVVGSSLGLELPGDFPICKRTDPNINECAKNAIQVSLPKLEKGLPQFNLDPIEPLEVASMTIGEGKGAVHVVQKFKNVKIYGVSKAKINAVDVTIHETTFDLDIDAFIDEIRVEADYDFNGRVLVLPIVGNGPSTTVMKNIQCKVQLKAVGFHKKNDDYMEIKHLDISLQPEAMTFNFENLFNGDPRLGPEMNKLLTENWKEIWDDVKGGYEETVAQVIMRIANLIFKKVPYNKLFPA